MDTSAFRELKHAFPVLLTPGDWWITNPGTGIELVEVSFDGDNWDSGTVTPTTETYIIPGGLWVRPASTTQTLHYRPAYDTYWVYYTNREKLNNMFGSQNIEKWSDLDNDGTEEAVIETRIYEEIQNVHGEINGHLCHLYDTPFDPVPRQIQMIATAFVGHNLRDARYMSEEDDTVLRKYERAWRDLMLIKEGAIRLPNLKARTTPSYEAT